MLLLFVHVFKSTRLTHNVPEKSSVAGTVALEGQQPMIQDDSADSTTDDPQGQIFMVSSNPAYGSVTKHTRKPAPQDDHTYANVGSYQQVAVVTSGKPALSTSLRVVAGAK